MHLFTCTVYCKHVHVCTNVLYMYIIGESPHLYNMSHPIDLHVQMEHVSCGCVCVCVCS